MKRINDLHACLLISFIVHTGMVGPGMLHFDLLPKDKPFEVALEIQEEILPEVFEVKEEKKLEPPVIDQEDVIEPVPDESITEVPEPVQDDEELKKSFLRYQDSIKQKIQKEKQYPRWALRSKYQGVVRLVFDVLPTGQIEALILDQSSGFEELDNEALAAVKRASPFATFPKIMRQDKIRIQIDLVFVLDKNKR